MLSVETYALAKKYTDKKIKEFSSFDLIKVDVLPTTDINEHAIYFVPKNKAMPQNGCYEYVYINKKWELIGSTDFEIEEYLKNYYTKEEIDKKFEDKTKEFDDKYVTQEDVEEIIGDEVENIPEQDILDIFNH